MKRLLFSAIFILGFFRIASGQNSIAEDFTPACDSLAVLLKERTGIEGPLVLKTAMKRGSAMDFYFTETLGDFAWYKGDVKWFKSTLKSLFPEKYRKFRVGEIFSRKVSLEHLVMPGITYDGKPADTRHRVRVPSGTGPIVRRAGRTGFGKGLEGRHIALWQSHGSYYDHADERWTWQRPCLFQTCEDMFTQGFVLPYLVPMLENAGAYVMLPRERDIQRNEIIADNDTTSGGRGFAVYEEKGKWESAGAGFADVKPVYEGVENPFTTGTARQTSCVGADVRPDAQITWTPSIPERGRYAVYVSYKSLPSSTSAAHYTVHHLGGSTDFAVNQKMGGGTWIYLGTFEFDEGCDGHVTLDNGTPEGYSPDLGGVVTADAVRFGGGMGNIARQKQISGLPRYAEAARYWLQWAGADSTVYHQNEGKDDYRDDFMSRGDWVEWLSRGSRVNPNRQDGPGIPVDLSFGFHTDAGVTPNDSLVGTLAIYTYRSEGKTELPDGENRLTSRLYADMVQSQIVNDLRSQYDTLWPRRSIWDRSYRESRTPSCPAMLLELLSHQNFADMKYGLDPSFRFDVSRAVYKGMLKYLSARYGKEYAVQPLPVEDIGVAFGNDGKAVVSWKPVEDPIEPTASPEGYIVYTRKGDGAFDEGVQIEDCRNEEGRIYAELPLSAGTVYSFRIAAYNKGGISFPSETVSIGMPQDSTSVCKTVIVNNFDRISGPAYIDTPTYAGFDDRTDSGVPYMNDITHVGEMHDFRRADQWLSNDNPGFGASYSDMAGEIIAGNTFDYISVHGNALLKAGHAFCSCSNERFISDSTFTSGAEFLDLICGKQVTVSLGMKKRHTVFSREMQDAIRNFASKGGNMLISGAYIGTDIWGQVYPSDPDSTFRAESFRFAKDVLGFRHVTGKASRKGVIRPASDVIAGGFPTTGLVMEKNPEIYCVESPDGIAPASPSACTICRYADSGISAGVAYEGDGYRCVSLGFPIEALVNKDDIDEIIRKTIIYFGL